MLTELFSTPILFIIFNRPETTTIVFEAIRKARPSRLYIAADGARNNVPGDIEQCLKAREISLRIDWRCEVKTLFNEKNMGCKIAVSSAIDWFFDNEEEGIILEDDCVPHPTFFKYCSDLLEKYRKDSRVMHIGGASFLPHHQFGEREASYYFSRDPFVWGWASWRRAWMQYDVLMKKFPEFVSNKLFINCYSSKEETKYWQNAFEKTFNGKIDTWDYQWRFAILSSSGLCIVPKGNFITNIGFGATATHTKDNKGFNQSIPHKELLAIHHPIFLLPDSYADSMVFRNIYRNSITKRITNKLKTIRRLFRYYLIR